MVMNGPTPIMFAMFNAVAGSSVRRRSSGAAVAGVGLLTCDGLHDGYNRTKLFHRHLVRRRYGCTKAWGWQNRESANKGQVNPSYKILRRDRSKSVRDKLITPEKGC
jgi:hypothetical protein